MESLTAYIAYRLQFEGPTVQCTNRFLIEAALDRHGVKLGPKQVEAEKEKFVSRPGRPASRIELAVVVSKGFAGTPSELLPTGILDLIGQNAQQAS